MKTKRVWLTGEDGKEAIVTMNVADDPYNDYRPYHMAVGHTSSGVVPLCRLRWKRIRVVNLETETWTIRWEAVTCPRCLALRSREAEIIAEALEAAHV